MGHLQSLKLNRQIYAFDQVKDHGNKEYKSAMEQVGMMIYNSGLISTLAFIKNKESRIYIDIKTWFCKQEHIEFSLNESEDLLIKALQIEDPMILIEVTREVLKLTDTFKEILKGFEY
ncbi:MAG: type III-B CRISPR module-associated protein Cmr5 [Deltaproteobacteria bacterium]